MNCYLNEFDELNTIELYIDQKNKAILIYID